MQRLLLVLYKVNMNIVFVSYEEEFIAGIKEYFAEDSSVSYKLGDVLGERIDGRAFVTATNTITFMDSRADYVISHIMFPGLIDRVRTESNTLNLPYLPIGSAIVIEASEISAIVSAPTMLYPTNVRNTRNAYASFMAVLCVFKKYMKANPKIKTLVCGAPCCGWGGMEGREAAKQVFDAYLDFHLGKSPVEDPMYVEYPHAFIKSESANTV